VKLLKKYTANHTHCTSEWRYRYQVLNGGNISKVEDIGVHTHPIQRINLYWHCLASSHLSRLSVN